MEIIGTIYEQNENKVHKIIFVIMSELGYDFL